jgi:8-oxo-dGTP pyrophosphatase MutT (NUDIX family)
MLVSKLRTYLSELDAVSDPELEAEQRLAAVLILLAPGDDGPELIFTRRSEDLSSHAGQISFPGGTIEADDTSPVHTALRESEEEIGLNSANVDILGTLDWYTMPTGFIVLPVVAHLRQKQDFTAAPDEVAEIFSIPLHTLLDISLYKSDSITRNGVKRLFYYFEFKEYYIWGATAAMLRTLALKLSKELLEE